MILERTFDPRSKTIDRDLLAFKDELKALEKKVAPATLVTSVKREGGKVKIIVLTATRGSAAPAEGNALAQWQER
jgi:hypothetical protein